MAKAKLTEEAKRDADTVLGFVMYGIGLAILAYGFVLALATWVPNLQIAGSGIVVGGLVFGIGVAVFKMRV